ncbi:MAG TPA: type IV pilus biogenesis/stability protein PilW [Pseudomonadales bacterium]|nr:type IV pilus biogenesis/stability protein PilW [Pseudomonadales bacterium]
MRLRSILYTATLTLSLSACVTETSDPLLGKVDKEKAVQSHVNAARAYWNQEHNNQRAHKHLSKALEIDPNSADAHDVLALLYADEGEPKLAEENFLSAISNAGPKKEAAMRNNYAVFLYSRGRYDEALEQLLKATADTTYTNRANAFVNLGRCYSKLKRQDDAEQAFERALKLDPRRAATWLDYADNKFEQGDYAKAKSALLQYQQLSDNMPTPKSLWLGIRLERILGDRDKLASYELALKNLFPNSPEYKEYLASKH